ncbi:MAG TPA: hypothetical protein PKN48_04540 [Bacteroidales bacterium]|nr:hypothetical protein [Bacteroidales bacterium]
MRLSRIIKNIIFLFLFVLILSACGRRNDISKNNVFEVKDFKTLTNWNVTDSTDNSRKLIYLDYTDAIDGFTIPSVRQTSDGYFHFKFSVRNFSGEAQKFYYNLYYQNESYKFPECAKGSAKEHPYANENFYGSRNADSLFFAETPLIPADGEFHEVEFRMKITGNPRNEKRYFDKNVNQRWKRNPRAGEYSILLVVSTKENLDKKLIPDHIADISLMEDSTFKNPYYYFLYGKGKNVKNLTSVFSGSVLRVIARPGLDAGIYINPDDFISKKYLPATNKYCGSSGDLYKNAPLRPYASFLDTSLRLSNIPVIADVINDNYTLRDFNWNRTFHKKEEMIVIQAGNSDCSCSQLSVDTLKSTVTMRNKASRYGEWNKLSTGVMTRHGLTYGKYTVKIKMTELLNKSGIWNGITNAVWLVSQKNESWNNCRSCRKEGYLPKYWGSGKNDRSEFTGYSEIDFEILKTVSYCPLYQFPPSYYYPVADRTSLNNWNVPLPLTLQRDSANIMVCCTNWDMACPDPVKYDVGCKPINYGNETFLAHRWDHWYQALSERSPAPDDELFASGYYYFQIEWKPEEIIWRIGPQKNKLKVVAYMNSTITCVPNNQMVLVISQEFHDTEWWHGSPFAQRFIPFPKNELPGTIYEITIE